jgi:hypothetical protein
MFSGRTRTYAEAGGCRARTVILETPPEGKGGLLSSKRSRRPGYLGAAEPPESIAREQTQAPKSHYAQCAISGLLDWQSNAHPICARVSVADWPSVSGRGTQRPARGATRRGIAT